MTSTRLANLYLSPSALYDEPMPASSSSSLTIPVIDWLSPGAEEFISALRQKLSVRGDIVSEAGRRRTLELFGAPLTPQQVVERICGDVSRRGLPAVLDYTQKLDGKQLTAETI